MEAVRSFNNELSSLYEARPPVSRAKMANVTKCAIKAIKFYKHVVQSVEKFILKCKPEYKVPGLYVIDSIVRQSRHQFGQEKDVFAPRFTKNVVTTFQNLFKCPPDEKSKIVRVLNLWQMNGVFPTAVIQPLLDMAAETTSETLARAQQAVDAVVAAHTKHAHHSAEENKKANIPEPEEAIEPKENDDSELAAEPTAENILATQTDMLNTVTMLLQQTQQGGATSLTEQQAQLEQLQLLQQQLTLQTQLMQMPQQQTPLIDTNLLSQIQTLTNQLLNKTATSGLSEQKPPEPGFNKKLLDFDYGDSDEEDDRAGKEKNNLQGTVQNILSDSTLMQHIQQMSQNIQKTEPLRNEIDEEENIRQKVLEQQQAEFDREINQTLTHQVPHIPPSMQQSLQQNIHEAPIQQPINIPQEPQFCEPSTNYSDPPQNFNEMPPNFNEHSEFPSENQYHNDLDVDMREQQEQASHEHQERDHRDEERSSSRRKSHRSRDRSRSRSPRRRKRSRSRSRDRRRRSRSRDRRRRSRSRDRDRDKRERERERRRKGLPPIKDNCISVCTRTLWFGHLSKMTSEEELQNEIEKYGKVESINMIPPRGCAFVVMCRRKDGAKAVDRLKGVKINGSALKVAYAPGIGVKDAAYKDYWDVELGASYIPWENLPQDLDALVEGGMVDEDSLPTHLKGVQIGKSSEADVTNEESKPATNEIVQQQQPQISMPQGMPQFRQPVPGMLPVVPQMMPPMMMAIPQGSVAPGQLGMPPVSIPPVSMPPVRPPNLVPISIAQGASSTPIVNPIQPAPPTIPALSQQAPSVTSAANVSFPGPSVSFPTPPLSTSTVGSLPQMSQTIPPPRPGFPHPPGFQNFNPSMPPPNFRLPPPAFNSPRPPVVRPPFENQTGSEERSGSPNFDGSGNEDDDIDDEPSEVSKETPVVATPAFPPPGPMNPRPMHPLNVMGMGMRCPNPGPGLLPPPPGGPRPMLTDESSDSSDNRPDNRNFREQPNMVPMGMPHPRGPVPQPGFNGFGGIDPRGFPPGMPRFPMRPGGFGDPRGRPRFHPNFQGGPPGPGFRGPPGMMMRPGFGDMRPRMDGPPPFGNVRPPIRGLMDDAPDDIPEDFDLDLRGSKFPDKYDEFDEDQDDRDKDDRDQDDRVQSNPEHDNRSRDHRSRNHRDHRDRDHRDRDHRDRDHRDRDHRDRDRDRDRRDRDHRNWNHRDRDHRDRDRDRDRDSDLREDQRDQDQRVEDQHDQDHRDQEHHEQDHRDIDHRDRGDSDNRFAEQGNDSFGDIDSRKSDVQSVAKENSNSERRQRKKNRWTDNTDIVDQEPINNENNNNATDNIGMCEEPETNGEKIENLEQENPDILNPEVVDGGSTPTEAEPPTT